MIAFTREIWYTEGEKIPHIAAASESAANTIQKPKPYTIQECMI